MASASDHRAHAALQPADCLILLPHRLSAAVETPIGPAHYPAECTQSDAFLQPSLRARKGRANSNSFLDRRTVDYSQETTEKTAHSHAITAAFAQNALRYLRTGGYCVLIVGETVLRKRIRSLPAERILSKLVAEY